MNSPYPSTLLENAVNEFARLPGIGRKSALRLVLHLLRQEEGDVARFTESLMKLKQEVQYCACCHNISDTEICAICADPARDSGVLCVVENIKEVMAIEKTVQFSGQYHVLGGIISVLGSGLVHSPIGSFAAVAEGPLGHAAFETMQRILEGHASA